MDDTMCTKVVVSSGPRKSITPFPLPQTMHGIIILYGDIFAESCGSTVGKAARQKRWACPKTSF